MVGFLPPARNLQRWRDPGREAMSPAPSGPKAPRRTEQRAVVLQRARRMDDPMFRSRVQA